MRPSIDQYFTDLAKLVATRSTCLRRAVGCVLVDARHHVIATGYNGVAAGLPHCNEEMYEDEEGIMHELDPLPQGEVRRIYPHACAGASAVSGHDLDACEAIHAEQNALLQCRDTHAIDTAYVTISPCLTCVKLLMNTSCRRIVFIEPYPSHYDQAESLWIRQAGRTWETNDV